MTKRVYVLAQDGEISVQKAHFQTTHAQ